MMSSKVLPYFAAGQVVKGFGRGSKSLGTPTANYPLEVVEKLPPEIDSGVYYGFASVDNGSVYDMVMSIGWNPFFKNTVKSMETHILHKFQNDFYGKQMKVIILGYLRPQTSFSSLDELIEAINKDIENAKDALKKTEFASYKNHEFFLQH